jgi:peroxiredoxin
MQQYLFLKKHSETININPMRWLTIVLCVCVSLKGISQTDSSASQKDTLAEYEKYPYIPAFNIQLPDKTWFGKNNIQSKKPTLIFYFSPDCGHCQTETEGLLSKIKDFGNLQVIMITSRPFNDMANFADHYKLARFPSIKIGTDAARYVTRFYDVRFTPFSALYDKRGRLIKVYKEGIDMAEIATLVK